MNISNWLWFQPRWEFRTDRSKESPIIVHVEIADPFPIYLTISLFWLSSASLPSWLLVLYTIASLSDEYWPLIASAPFTWNTRLISSSWSWNSWATLCLASLWSDLGNQFHSFESFPTKWPNLWSATFKWWARTDANWELEMDRGEVKLESEGSR